MSACTDTAASKILIQPNGEGSCVLLVFCDSSRDSNGQSKLKITELMSLFLLCDHFPNPILLTFCRSHPPPRHPGPASFMLANGFSVSEHL